MKLVKHAPTGQRLAVPLHVELGNAGLNLSGMLGSNFAKPKPCKDVEAAAQSAKFAGA
ncbi:MAG: hypothetical protein ABSD29_15170 [Verrucomicrobiota bacterium]